MARIPCSVTLEAATYFEKAVVDALAASCNLVLSEQQRARTGFSVKKGGMGVHCLADRVDAAYIASRAATHDLGKRIHPQHQGAHGDRDDHLQHAMELLQAKLPRCEILTGELGRITQNRLNKEINKFTIEQWKNTSQPAERVHLQAYSALGCRYEVVCVPSKMLNMSF